MVEKDFMEVASKYSLEYINTIAWPLAIERIQWHQAQWDQAVIIYAPLEYWLKPWCEIHNLEVLATKLKIGDRLIVGKFQANNCYGIEKENRITEAYNLRSYEHSYSYCHSRNDREILALADIKECKPF